MKVVSLGAGFFGIQHVRFSPALVACSRLVPGMKWDEGAKAWTGHGDAVEVVVRLLRGKGLRLESDALTRAVGIPIIPIAEKGLRDYQKLGVRFLILNGAEGCLLADDMGLGKTATALIAARALNSKTLVVCPQYVRGVWWDPVSGGEIKRWWPTGGKAVFLPKRRLGTPIPPSTQIVVVHYEILSGWVKALKVWGPRVVVFDEGQALANERSKRSIAAAEVAALTPFRWILTGTPLTNRPRDVFGLVQVLSPGRFGKDFFGFGLRYCDGHKVEIPQIGKTVWQFDGASNLEELNSRLQWLMLRRLKSEVSLELPQKTRQIMWLQPPKKKSGMAYARNAKELRAALNLSADAKLPEGLELVLGHATAGARVVVFCYRRAVAEWIANAAREAGVATVGLVHGGVGGLRRGKAIADVQRAPGGGVLAVTIDSCSTGIDLSFASVAVVLELTYEPHKLLQLESRLHRFGARLPVLIQYLCARGTVDEIVVGKVVTKLDTFEAAIGATGEAIGSELSTTSDDDILREILAGVGEK
jgi:SWI/SNF-related matrix-associated actin-dependent regulator 1 of chromatin subfamily A